MRRAAAGGPQRQLVTFRVGGSEFGVAVLEVQEVIRSLPVTPVPRAPTFVRGVFELRGELLPLVDLRYRFEVPDAQDDSDTRVLVVHAGDERLGLIVDRVTEVLPVAESAFAPLPPRVQRVAPRGLESVVRIPGRLILVLDLEQLLSSEERFALRELETALRQAEEHEDAPESPQPEIPGDERGLQHEE